MGKPYWFARNIRAGYQGSDRYGKGVMPIAWQGRAVIAGFVAAMLGGGLIMFVLGFYAHQMALGIGLYVILVIAGAGTFIRAVATRSDPDKSLTEYLAERQQARSAGR
ncbi:hypothetical protein EN873_17380 [bacterium M00.F.Ca.ET.230.01.1.1]|nr:hypothetical protein EN873_17380 [bacterium M00.F.Ca.ET.230.01.1.1]